ncbi:MAG: hypothetical protein L0Y79_03170 [Chlorobi bacterium]|nr:hypothetical protein [Chlorobiota bacterium]MCI0716039.1 hypothetical protein [Chlorobiota bacterium]
MQNTKIISFLKCLSRHELREFGKFVRSPFHNNRKDVIRLYDILRKSYPDFKKEEVSKQTVFEKLYPDRKYDPNTMILHSAYLYNLGKQFLTVSGLMGDTFAFKYHYLKKLDLHFADNLFEKEYRDAKIFLNAEKLNKEFFNRKAMLEELMINFSLNRNRQDKIHRNTVDYGDYFIYSFIVKLVVLYHGMLVDKMSFNYEFTGSSAELFIRYFNFEEFINSLPAEKNEYHDFVLYYYYMFMGHRYPENDYYYPRLKEYTFKNFEKLHSAEKSSRFHYVIEYCLMQLKTGNLKFLREAFNLYTEALEKKLYKSDSDEAGMGLIFFRNFIVIGLIAKEHDYIENFISTHGKEIKGEMRDDTLELSNAMLYLEKKEYNKSLEHLNKVSSAFPLFKLSTKFILIKIYYETNQYDSFFSLMDTYRHYLKNEKIITELIRGYHTNFLNYLGMLVKIKSSGSPDNLYIIKKEIKENMNMDFRHKLWLLEKADELEKVNI